MRFLLGRDGNISIIRVGSIAAVVGILFIIGAVVAFFADQASHQQPLDISPYPGATLVSTVPHSNISRSVYYQIPNASADDVASYYQTQMKTFYGASDELCVRAPAAGNFPDYDNGKPNVAPYEVSCMFDRSGFNTSQYTRVNIQPGIASNNTQGMVIVEYEQYWQH